MKFNGQERRTTTKWDKNRPVWNEGFLFDENVEIINNDGLKFDLYIYDEDTWSSDEIIKKESVKIDKNQNIKETTVCGINIEYGFIKCIPLSLYTELSNKSNKMEKIIDDVKKINSQLNGKISTLEFEKDALYNKYIQIKNKVSQFVNDVKSV